MLGGVPQSSTQPTPEDKKKYRKVDYRARLQLFKKFGEKFFADDNNVLTPLKANRGVVFPYTPNLYIARQTEYGEMAFKGANYPIYAYVQSRPPIIPIIATFTASTQEEAMYSLAAWRFFNVLTQSDFGLNAVAQGVYGRPPPILEFSYMGPFGFDRVPVILNDFNVIFGNNVEMVPVPHSINDSFKSASAFGDKQVTYVPVEMEFTINLAIQYSPRRVRKDFDLDAMRKGRNIGFL
jgi:hypothetical protein